MTTISLNRPIQKVDHGSKYLVTQTRYVLEQLEPSQIMHLLVNIDSDSSQMKSLSVHAVFTQLNRDDIFFTNVSDLTAIGIQEKTHLVISLCFWSSIQMHFHFAIH